MHRFIIYVMNVLLGTSALSAFAATAEQAAVFVFVRADVSVRDPDNNDQAAVKGMSLNTQHTIVTGNSGYAQLQFSDGNRLVVRSNTELRLDEYHFAPDKANRLALSLNKGSFRSVTGEIGRQQPQNYLVKTAVGIIGVRGTDHEPTYIPPPKAGETSELKPGLYDKVNRGVTILSNALGSVSIGANQAGFIGLNGASPIVLPSIPSFYAVSASTRQHDKEASEMRQGNDAEKARDQAEKRAESRPGAPPPRRLEAPAQRADAPPPPLPRRNTPNDPLGQTPAGSESWQQETADPSAKPEAPPSYQVPPPPNGTPPPNNGQLPPTGSNPPPVDHNNPPLSPTGSSGIFSSATENAALLTHYTTPSNAANDALGDALSKMPSAEAAQSRWQLQDSHDSTAIQWGRWQAVTPANLLPRDIHWISAPASTPALPRSGIYQYTLSGGTLPTDTQGDSGQLNAAHLQVDFNRATVDAQFDLSISQQHLTMRATTMPIADTGFKTQQPASVQCDACTSASGAIEGRFVGETGEQAISGYRIQTDNQHISGTAAFVRQ